MPEKITQRPAEKFPTKTSSPTVLEENDQKMSQEKHEHNDKIEAKEPSIEETKESSGQNIDTTSPSYTNMADNTRRKPAEEPVTQSTEKSQERSSEEKKLENSLTETNNGQENEKKHSDSSDERQKALRNTSNSRFSENRTTSEKNLNSQSTPDNQSLKRSFSNSYMNRRDNESAILDEQESVKNLPRKRALEADDKEKRSNSPDNRTPRDYKSRQLETREGGLSRSNSHSKLRSRPSSESLSSTTNDDIRKPWVFYGCSNVSSEYRILDKLGEGTFGEVHRGEKVSNKFRVALKRIFLHNEKEGFPITALREIRILKALNHSNIIPIIDMAIQRPDRGGLQTRPQRGSVYMITPYMEHDLAGLLGNPSVNLELPYIKCYMYQFFQGMKYLHDQQYLHRDIKSANILIDNWGCLRIADFGLARHYYEKPPRPGTGAGKPGREYTSMVVTRWYRAPELVLGENRYTTAVDMWGVGCIFGEMFKRHPFLQGVSDQDQAHCIFKLLGGPTPVTMPGYEKLPGGRTSFPYTRTLEERFHELDKSSMMLLSDLLKLDPQKRLTAVDALSHEFFKTEPRACRPEELPRYNDSHELDARRARKDRGPPAPFSNEHSGRSPVSHGPPPPQMPQRSRGGGPPASFLDDAVLPGGVPYSNGNQHHNGYGNKNAHHSYHSRQHPYGNNNPKYRQGNGHPGGRERGFRYEPSGMSASMYDGDLGPMPPHRGRPPHVGGYRDNRSSGRYHSGDSNEEYPAPPNSQPPPPPMSRQPDRPNSVNPAAGGNNRQFSFKGAQQEFSAASLPPRPSVSTGRGRTANRGPGTSQGGRRSDGSGNDESP